MPHALKLSLIKPGENAERSGLRSGDILITYAGERISTSDELITAVSRQVGTCPVEVGIQRDGILLSVNVGAGPLGVVVSPCDEAEIANAAEARRIAEAVRAVVVTTAPAVDGYRTHRTIDVVSSEYALGMNIFKDILTSLSDTFGGRSGTLQKAMREARIDALNDLRATAYELGANAVIATRIEYTEFSGQGKSMLLVAAYGTAVEVTPEKNS